MKITYNWLKDFVEIKISPKALADKLTMAGLEVTSFEEKDKDSVFEIEVTSNRPDCLSVIGIAREVAAITGKKLTGEPVSQLASSNRQTRKPANPLTIIIENRKDCPLYTAKIIRNVKVGPSPDWLKKRLELVGCRSVNNIVDITNYILFEWGQPLHAFDLDKLVSQSSGKPVSGLACSPVSQLTINIRRAVEGEEIVTIDAVKRILTKDILVIASEINPPTRQPANPQTDNPIAMAGIMGSKDTEVTESTKNILLETAVFAPILIRKARVKLCAQTDSSYRFERGIDSAKLKDISWRAVELILSLAQGECVLAKDCGRPAVKKKKVNLDSLSLQRILGSNIARPAIKKILANLGFKAKTLAENKFSVEIPAHRQDINLEIDLIEEVSRVFGYKNIAPTLPAVVPQINARHISKLPRLSWPATFYLKEGRDLVSLIKNTLVGLGLNEVITYSLVGKDLLQIFGNAKAPLAIEVLNPLSKDQEALRPALTPSLSRCIAYNLNQKQEVISIFEVAKVFSQRLSQVPQEELTLGIGLCGIKSLLLEQGVVKDKLGVLHLKGIIETLFARLGVEGYKFNWEDSYRLAVYAQEERIGSILRLPEAICDKLDIKNKDVILGEFSLDILLNRINLSKRFVKLPIYPGITRDISFILKEDITLKDIVGAVKEKAGHLLKEVKLIDYYKGRQIPCGFKSLTISCLYRSDERTLTESEINPMHSLAVGVLMERFSAKIR